MLNTCIYIFFHCLQNIHSTIELKNNAIDFLYEIGNEENFNITYILMKKDLSKK